MAGKAPKRWRSSPAGARRFVAVDFDSRQVRLVEAHRSGGGVRVVRLLSRAAPEGLDLADAKAVGLFLQAALKENRLAGWPVVLCVPRGMAVLKTLSFPPGTPEAELAGMVHYQVEKELPFRPEEAVVDFTTETHFRAGAGPQEAGGTSVLVAAVRVPVVDYFRQIALAAGTKLLRLGLKPYANQRCFSACMAGEWGRTCALVHVTADETEIDVVAGNSLAFSRSVAGKAPPGAAREPDLAETARAVVTEVVRSLQSYQSVEGGGKVERVYLAGGTGVEPLVAKELADRLGLPCEVFHPAEAMRLGAAARGASEFIAALGSAVGYPASPLDFLHPKRPAAPRNTRRTKALVGVAAAVVLLLASVAAGGRYLSAKQDRVAALSSEYRKLKLRKDGMDANAARASAVEAWQRGGQDWLDHVAILSALFPGAQDVYVGGIVATPDGSLNFTVHAASEKVITDIIEGLGRSGYEVTAGKQSKGNDPRYPHTADLRVRPGPNLSVDLASLEAQPRPEDDMAAGELPRPRPRPAASPSPAPAGGMGQVPAASPSPVPSPQGFPGGGRGGAGQGGFAGGGQGAYPGGRGMGGQPAVTSEYTPGQRDANRMRRFGAGGTGGGMGRGGRGG